MGLFVGDHLSFNDTFNPMLVFARVPRRVSLIFESHRIWLMNLHTAVTAVGRISIILQRSKPSIWLMMVVAIMVASLSIMTLGAAQESASNSKAPISLEQVSADTAFYACSARLGEQLDILMQSQAFTRMKFHPFVQIALSQGMQIWNSDDDANIVAIREALELEENQELLQILGDAMSQEVFVTADAQTAKTLLVYREINQIAYDALLADDSFFDLETEREERSKLLMLDAVLERIDNLKVPRITVGFRVSNVDVVDRQLARLVELLQSLPDEFQVLQKGLQIEQSDPCRRLTLTLKGVDIPFDSLRNEITDASPELRSKLEALINAMKTRSILLSCGVQNGFFVVSVGPDELSQALPSKGQRLIDAPPFAPLVEHLNKPILSVNYVSDEMAKSTQTSSDYFLMYGRAILKGAEQALQQEDIPEELIHHASDDLGELFDDVSKLFPVPGRTLTFQWRSEHGIEGYHYDYSQNTGVDGSKLLTILNHVGTDPLFVSASRSPLTKQQFSLIRKWCGRIPWYLEFAESNAPDERSRETSTFVLKNIIPQLQKLGDIIETKFIPGFSDGQSCCVVGAKTTSSQWQGMLPTARKELTAFDIACVMSMSDRELVIQGMMEVRDVAENLIQIFANESPDIAGQIPFHALLHPQHSTDGDNEVYAWQFPDELNIDPQLAFNISLNNEVAVLSFAPLYSTHLLEKQPAKLSGPAADHGRPLASMLYLNFEKSIETIIPWFEYGYQIAEESSPDNRMIVGLIRGNAAPIFDVLKCFTSFSSATWVEDDATVTNFALEFRDL